MTAGVAMADYTLNILHINDQHSRIEAINKFDSTCSAEEESKNECFGGIARVKAKIDERRAALSKDGGNVIVLDAGDEFQGSLFYTTYKGDDTAEFMNSIGFDVMALGNHEFDDTPVTLAKFLDKVKFPVISSNTEAAADSPIAGKYKPYIVKEIGGQKIGIISALTTDTAEISSPGPSVKFADEIETLKKQAEALKAEGVNKIIAVNHDGYLKDKEIAAKVDGIDVIVGGHSHTLLSNTDPEALGPYPTLVKNPSGRDVPIVQAKSYSKYLGELKVTFDDDGNVTKSEGAPILLDSSVTPDPAFVARIKELAKPIEELKAKKVGESSGVIEAAREVCRFKECSMGDAGRRCHARPRQGTRRHHRHHQWRRPARINRCGRSHHGRSADGPAVPEHAGDFPVARLRCGRSAGKRRQPDRSGRRAASRRSQGSNMHSMCRSRSAAASPMFR